MCLSVPTSNHFPKPSHHDPKPEPHRSKAKHRHESSTNFPNPPAHLEHQNRHQSSSHGKPYTAHHRSKIPDLQQHIQIPKHNDTHRTPRNRTSKTITIQTKIPPKSKDRKNSSSSTQQPAPATKNYNTQTKAPDCPRPPPRVKTCQHDRTKAAKCQNPNSSPKNTLLNNQGIPTRLILPTTKSNLKYQTRIPQCELQKPITNKKKTAGLHTLNPTHTQYGLGSIPFSTELSEERQFDSLRQVRKHEHTVVHHSSGYEVEMSKSHRQHLSSLSYPHEALPASHREHAQYWCAICGAADMESAFGGRCCACSDDDRVRGGGFGFGGEKWVDVGWGGGRVIGRNGMDGGEREMGGGDGRERKWGRCSGLWRR